MEEIKDFFIRNGADESRKKFYLSVGMDIDLILENNKYLYMHQDDRFIYVGKPTLDRLKALIYGLTGINLN